MNILNEFRAAFPSWSWDVTGVRDRATVYGRRDGFEPLTFDVMVKGMALVITLDFADRRYRGEGTVSQAVGVIMDEVDTAKRRATLAASALRSMRAKVKS